MEIKSEHPYVFQVDSDIVQRVYKNNKNYLIDYNEDCTDKSTCAIYFSSNDIYYPNEEGTFEKRIVEKDFFEWYGTRNKNVYKHILIRDVFKQWYLSGINKEIDSPEKLIEFLLKETEGYSVTTLGSSAGGYAAVLYGSLIKAKKAIAFNAQFEINTLLDSSNEIIDPLIFRSANSEKRKYYEVNPFVSSDLEVFYFTSIGSKWDSEQCDYIKDVKSINVIKFKTNHHGIPFLKSALDVVLNLDSKTLKSYTKGVNNPILFSIKMVGLFKVMVSAYEQLMKRYKRKLSFVK